MNQFRASKVCQLPQDPKRESLRELGWFPLQKRWLLGCLIGVYYYLVGEPREDEATLQMELHKSSRQENMSSLRLSDKFQRDVRKALFYHDQSNKGTNTQKHCKMYITGSIHDSEPQGLEELYPIRPAMKKELG